MLAKGGDASEGTLLEKYINKLILNWIKVVQGLNTTFRL